jgi:hypothetical protein
VFCSGVRLGELIKVLGQVPAGHRLRELMLSYSDVSGTQPSPVLDEAHPCFTAQITTEEEDSPDPVDAKGRALRKLFKIPDEDDAGAVRDAFARAPEIVGGSRGPCWTGSGGRRLRCTAKPTGWRRRATGC